MASDPMDLTVIFRITSGSVCRLQHSVTAVAVMSLLPIASNTQHSTSSNMRRRASFISVTNQSAHFITAHSGQMAQNSGGGPSFCSVASSVLCVTRVWRYW